MRFTTRDSRRPMPLVAGQPKRFSTKSNSRHSLGTEARLGRIYLTPRDCCVQRIWAVAMRIMQSVALELLPFCGVLLLSCGSQPVPRAIESSGTVSHEVSHDIPAQAAPVSEAPGDAALQPRDGDRACVSEADCTEGEICEASRGASQKTCVPDRSQVCPEGGERDTCGVCQPKCTVQCAGTICMGNYCSWGPMCGSPVLTIDLPGAGKTGGE